jgi:hypothetical protein
MSSLNISNLDDYTQAYYSNSFLNSGMDPEKMRKDSHKEIERKRRENINSGIAELGSLIPVVGLWI